MSNKPYSSSLHARRAYRTQHGRRGRSAMQPGNHEIHAARAVAREHVREHWPDLAQVEPRVTRRAYYVPNSALVAQLGLSERPLAPPHDAYIFTFASEINTTEGHVFPRVACVTVEAGHVVKASVSR